MQLKFIQIALDPTSTTGALRTTTPETAIDGLDTGQIYQIFLLVDPRLVSFPAKHDWHSPSALDLISRSARQLATVLLAAPHNTADLPFVLPAPGMGLGGLTRKQVEPRLQPLHNLNVLVIAYQMNQFQETQADR